jgi:hypothetical protein
MEERRLAHDLTFVNIERRAEVRRRIDAIERFIGAPGRAAAEREAAELGIHAAQFYNLVRAWRETGRPERLSDRHGPRRRQPTIDQRTLDLIDVTIAENGRATARDLIDDIARRAAAAGIALPDPSTVARHVGRKRPHLLPAGMAAGLDLALDHTVLELPVDFGAGPILPLLTIAVEPSADAIVGLALSPGVPTMAVMAAAIRDALRHGVRNEHRVAATTKVGLPGRPAARRLMRVLEDHGCGAEARGGVGAIANAVLGRERAGLRFKPRFVWKGNDRRRVELKGSVAISPTEALAMVRGRLVDRPSATPFAGLDDVSRSRLAIALAGLDQPD